MKLSKAKIQECAEWVEKNGLYPQACGAAVKQFCEAMGIKDTTYRRWLENVDFVDALTRAREVFRQTSVREVSNALIKAAKGVDFVKEKQEYRAQVIKEYDPKTGKKVKEYLGEKPVQVKAMRETYYYPPDVNAAKFVLTNMDPESWKNKQESDIFANMEMEAPPVIIFQEQPPVPEDAEDSPHQE